MTKKFIEKIDVFIVTNERSTFNYCYQSLINQSVDFRLSVIKNMSNEKALNTMLNNCESDYFLKVDDDFFLHPLAVEYMVSQIYESKNIVVWWWHLYETWTSKIVEAIKIYNKKRVKLIGGFKSSHTGRVDPVFYKEITKWNLRAKENSGVLALHACSTWKEQLYYKELWNKSALIKGSHKKLNEEEMRLYSEKVSPKDQFDSITAILSEVNKLQNSSFHNFIINSK